MIPEVFATYGVIFLPLLPVEGD
ncbi:hypothetical protein CGRA01v4_10997 [Colletotrichum graminicola]|nr:hypothetical protein CGRA01v4_10997 [Colletotrichum graminicola]